MVDMALVDRFVPAPEFRETHSITIRAPREIVWKLISMDVVTTRDPGLARAARPLLALRALIGRLGGRSSASDGPATLADAFIALDEEPGHEIVRGLVGQWWRFGANDAHPDVSTPEAFLAFDEPGYGKGTFSFALVTAERGRTTLVTETRVVTTDAAAHRSMTRYWLLIRGGSGLIRRVMLADIRRRAEASSRR